LGGVLLAGDCGVRPGGVGSGGVVAAWAGGLVPPGSAVGREEAVGWVGMEDLGAAVGRMEGAVPRRERCVAGGCSSREWAGMPVDDGSGAAAVGGRWGVRISGAGAGRPGVFAAASGGFSAPGGWKVTGGAALAAFRARLAGGSSGSPGALNAARGSWARGFSRGFSSMPTHASRKDPVSPVGAACPERRRARRQPLCATLRRSGILKLRWPVVAGETSPSLVYGAALLMRLGF
jgi:hypothetical protein